MTALMSGDTLLLDENWAEEYTPYTPGGELKREDCVA
jgi:hypothetical protein